MLCLSFADNNTLLRSQEWAYFKQIHQLNTALEPDMVRRAPVPSPFTAFPCWVPAFPPLFILLLLIVINQTKQNERGGGCADGLGLPEHLHLVPGGRPHPLRVPVVRVRPGYAADRRGRGDRHCLFAAVCTAVCLHCLRAEDSALSCAPSARTVPSACVSHCLRAAKTVPFLALRCLR